MGESLTPCSGKGWLFFSESPECILAAKKTCQGCRYQFRCLEGAVERREGAGVWGGQYFNANSRHDFLRRAGAARSAA